MVLRALPSLRVLALVVGSMACGASSPPPATHAHFEAAQRQETVQDEAERDALEGPCPDAREHAERSCQAATRLCAIAEETRDADLDLRCRRATERCQGHRDAALRCDAGAP
ncbi:MAG: hypothetical protein KF901_03115 [Myxococcales bacterium]|nr:hypothetical protein [Myxococcales bacterium]